MRRSACWLLLPLLLCAACADVHPERGTGAAAIPAGQGGGIGPVEGSPQNSTDLGPGVVPH